MHLVQLVRSREIYGAGEGLQNRICDAARRADSIEALDEAVLTRRYTRTRLHRTYLQMLFGLRREAFASWKQAFCSPDAAASACSPEPTSCRGYVRILGFNDTGAAALKFIKSHSIKDSGFTLLTNINKQREELSSTATEILDFETKITDLYNMISHRDMYEYSDLVRKPIIL